VASRRMNPARFGAPSSSHPEFIEGRDGPYGALLRMRADGGAMAFETGSYGFVN
jgi:hypothetical protein